jgi:hypothetical protein
MAHFGLPGSGNASTIERVRTLPGGDAGKVAWGGRRWTGDSNLVTLSGQAGGKNTIHLAQLGYRLHLVGVWLPVQGESASIHLPRGSYIPGTGMSFRRR